MNQNNTSGESSSSGNNVFDVDSTAPRKVLYLPKRVSGRNVVKREYIEIKVKAEPIISPIVENTITPTTQPIAESSNTTKAEPVSNYNAESSTARSIMSFERVHRDVKDTVPVSECSAYSHNIRKDELPKIDKSTKTQKVNTQPIQPKGKLPTQPSNKGKLPETPEVPVFPISTGKQDYISQNPVNNSILRSQLEALLKRIGPQATGRNQYEALLNRLRQQEIESLQKLKASLDQNIASNPPISGPSRQRPRMAKPAPAPVKPKRLPPLSAATRGRIKRANEQKMFCLSRTNDTEDPSTETLEILGSTGNNYTVTISSRMKCTCLDYEKKPCHCKHILMVLLKVYGIPLTHPMFHFLKTTKDQRLEVRSYSKPVDPSIAIPPSVREKIINIGYASHPETSSPRRALNAADCPLCFKKFQQQDIADIDYCKACGNNIHRDCFEKWSSMIEDKVKCTFCQHILIPAGATPRKNPVEVLDKKHVSDGSFVNYAEELGISRERDTSTYTFKKRRRRRCYYDHDHDHGFGFDDDDDEDDYY